jgi:predicted secreted hydrolase
MAGSSGDTSLAVARAVNQGDAAGFARVTGPRHLTFPTDHGPHPEYQTEWWYYTGNLQSPDGRQFGYQLTFFRRGLTASAPQRTSKWATRDVYFAHFAVTDASGKRFFSKPQIARGAEIGLAGAAAAPYHVFVNNWKASGTGDSVDLRATADSMSINFKLQAAKPMTLQGDHGYSPKSTGVGNATYYYSYTRMKTVGTLTINGVSSPVEGLSWFDHEFGTNPLGPEQIGWDWFGLHLEDGRDLMLGKVRRKDGGFDIIGSITGVKDTVPQLYLKDVRLTTLGTWVSPHTQIRYPSRWRLEIPAAHIDITIEPLLPDQELSVGFIYWEGAVDVRGSVAGKGYAELTGY